MFIAVSQYKKYLQKNDYNFCVYDTEDCSIESVDIRKALSSGISIDNLIRGAKGYSLFAVKQFHTLCEHTPFIKLSKTTLCIDEEEDIEINAYLMSVFNTCITIGIKEYYDSSNFITSYWWHSVNGVGLYKTGYEPIYFFLYKGYVIFRLVKVGTFPVSWYTVAVRQNGEVEQWSSDVKTVVTNKRLATHVDTLLEA